jgi:hypothetical protein
MSPMFGDFCGIPLLLHAWDDEILKGDAALIASLAQMAYIFAIFIVLLELFLG